MFIEFITSRVNIPEDKMAYGAVLMNNNRILGVELPFIGDNSSSVDIDFEQLLSIVKTKNATEVALFHNKPEVDITHSPGQDDGVLFEEAKSILEPAGIKILDNIILSMSKGERVGVSYLVKGLL